jgi:hypothetical protein
VGHSDESLDTRLLEQIAERLGAKPPADDEPPLRVLPGGAHRIDRAAIVTPSTGMPRVQRAAGGGR